MKAFDRRYVRNRSETPKKAPVLNVGLSLCSWGYFNLSQIKVQGITARGETRTCLLKSCDPSTETGGDMHGGLWVANTNLWGTRLRDTNEAHELKPRRFTMENIKLINRINSQSVSNDWQTAKKEWRLAEIEDVKEPDTSLCRHNPIFQL
jgi:hypothetical protein